MRVPPVVVEKQSSTTAIATLQEAKRVLGFSPIDKGDILYLQERLSLDSESLKIEAVREFLIHEMKISKAVADSLEIARTFTPAKQSDDWTTLYAEFTNISSVELINQYVTRLKPGKSVSIYVPHSLYPRFQSINSIAHSYRNGEVKHKTKVRYGTSDFVLLIKRTDGVSRWTYAPLNHLPPLELSLFDGNLSSSPAPGRQRLPSKRACDSPESETRCNKTKTDQTLPSSDSINTEDVATNVEQLSRNPATLTQEVLTVQPSLSCDGASNLVPLVSNDSGAQPKSKSPSSDNPINSDECEKSASSPILRNA